MIQMVSQRPCPLAPTIPCTPPIAFVCQMTVSARSAAAGVTGLLFIGGDNVTAATIWGPAMGRE